MIRKIVAGTLIVFVVSASGAMAYGNPIDTIKNDTIINNHQAVTVVEKKDVELISPQINPAGEVLYSKNLFISVKVLTDDSVYLSVYKVLEEVEEVILDSEAVIPLEELKIYSTEIKDVKPGNYKMKFTKQGEIEPFETLSFKLQEPTKPNLLEKKFSDLILGK